MHHHLHRRLVGLSLDGEGLPDAEILHVGHDARRPVDAPGALRLIGVFCLRVQRKTVRVWCAIGEREIDTPCVSTKLGLIGESRETRQKHKYRLN